MLLSLISARRGELNSKKYRTVRAFLRKFGLGGVREIGDVLGLVLREPGEYVQLLLEKPRTFTDRSTIASIPCPVP